MIFIEPTSKEEQLLMEISDKISEAIEKEDKATVREGNIYRLLATVMFAIIVTVGIISFTITHVADRLTTYIHDEVSILITEIQNQNQKIPQEENYEKQIRYLGAKIAEIEAEFEGDYDTEAVIFEEEVSQSYSKERLPEGINTNRYDCEPHTFGPGTQQSRLQSYCETEEETGLRYFLHDGVRYYCVAMGGAYGIDIGDIWMVTLECGSTFGIILSDYQHAIDDVDPNDFGECYVYDSDGNVIDILRNYDGEPVCHVLEFVVEIDKMDRYALHAGTMSALDQFGGLYGTGGNITDIHYLGRAWNADESREAA